MKFLSIRSSENFSGDARKFKVVLWCCETNSKVSRRSVVNWASYASVCISEVENPEKLYF